MPGSHNCENCGKPFPTPSKLAAHMNRKIACTAGAFVCNKCNHVRFTKRNARDRHRKRCKGRPETLEEVKRERDSLRAVIAQQTPPPVVVINIQHVHNHNDVVRMPVNKENVMHNEPPEAALTIPQQVPPGENAVTGDKVQEVITYMVQKWPKNIKTDENAGAHRPNITKRDLFKRLNYVIAASDKSVEDIMAEIVAKNDFIKTISKQRLFGRRPPKKQLSMFDRAKKNNFYLNLDCNRDIDWWISSLRL